LDEMLDRAVQSDVVFFGETHIDETTHTLELAVYKGLIRRTKGRVVLAMEMFQRDVQPVLDSYLAGEIDEATFLEKARPWGNYRTAYRPLIETAKREGLPVVASNVPDSIRRRVAFGGRKALDKLSGEERGFLATELKPNSEAYWKRFARVVRGHMRRIVQGSPERRLLSSQSLWDNTMGESCARAVERHPGWIVLHINGGFHSQFREGTVGQLLARRPAARVTVIEASPVDDFTAVASWFNPKRADFLAVVESRAHGLNEGVHAVRVSPALRYRISLPKGASDAKPAPLLIWLPADGLRSKDGLVRWRQALGDHAALVVVEPPYPQVEEDLSLGGRWIWGDTFNEDLGMLEEGLTAICGYVLRHYPIDPSRILLAGEGTGATVVAAASLYASDLAVPALAVAPKRFGQLHRLPLPGPRDAGPGGALGPLPNPTHALRVLALARDKDWWTREAAEHKEAGLGTQVLDAGTGGWQLAALVEKKVRRALGLAPQVISGAKADQPGLLLVRSQSTPRARHWALRLGLLAQKAGRKAAVVERARLAAFLASPAGKGPWQARPLALLGEPMELGTLPDRVKPVPGWGPKDFLLGRGLPLAAGPFGGTTILLLPAGMQAADQAAWKELQTRGAIHRVSRMAQLLVVPEHALGSALEQVLQSRRTSVLIVPAGFSATPQAMRRFRNLAAEYADKLTIEWLPGLGGGLRMEDSR